MNEQNFQNAIDFLMYSYFGNWKDDPLYATISRAYRDATMRKAFSFPDSKMKDILEQCGSEIIRKEIVCYSTGDEFKQETYTENNKKTKENTEAKDILEDKALREKINEEIDKIKKNEGKDKYTVWHEKLCTKLVTLYSFQYSKYKNDDNSSFSYGNAQKWVNMTMKYLYIISSILSERGEPQEWYKKIIDDSKYYHIPLDTYILKALFYEPRNGSISKKINCNYKGEGKLIEDKSKDSEKNFSVDGSGYIKEKDKNNHVIKPYGTWSNIKDYDDYSDLQEAIKAQIPKDNAGNFKFEPLIWENEVWTLAKEIL